MADLYVDVDALLELCGQLEEVKSSLRQAKADLSPSDQRLGSPDIGDALDGFADGWKGGRSKIIEGINGLQGRIRMAVAAYLEQEEALSGATR